MLLENLFGGVLGFILLCVFIVSTLFFLVYQLVKKDVVLYEEKTVEDAKKVTKIKELIKEEYKGFVIEEDENNNFVVKDEVKILKKFDKYGDCKVFIDVISLRKESNFNYEIVEIDGFFKVKKKGNERIIRKFVTYQEAENYVKEKENNDWSRTNR